MRYDCPVCGYCELTEPPQNFTICPSCGTEFGLDDFGLNTKAVRERWGELRWQWLDSGAAWWAQSVHAPAGWNPYRQLERAGLMHQLSEADAAHQSERIALDDAVEFDLVA